MEIFKKNKNKKQTKKQNKTNKQTKQKKQQQQQQQGKIAVPFPGKFGKRETAKKNNARCDAFCCDVRFRAYHTR